MASPDFVVVTASNPTQAANYRALLAARTEAVRPCSARSWLPCTAESHLPCVMQGLYPPSVAFRVYCDPPGGRVGSGGGTLVALMALLREEAPEVAAADPDAFARGVCTFFSSRRVLLLHAGGESRRLPCYVPEGKLFAPLALPSAHAFTPVVLDCLLSLYWRYPWEAGELILASGDVIVDFDTATLPTGFVRGDLCGFGKPTTLQQGCRHGVFAFGADGEVTRPVAGFLQKASVETLRAQALLSTGEGEACAVDTGIFSMSPRFVAAMLGWAASPAPEVAVGGGAASVLGVTEARRACPVREAGVTLSGPGHVSAGGRAVLRLLPGGGQRAAACAAPRVRRRHGAGCV